MPAHDTPPAAPPDPSAHAVATALAGLGLVAPDAETLTLAAQATLPAPPAAVWTRWAALDAWPLWSRPLHRAAAWLDGPPWQPGSRFREVLDLGDPAGIQHRTCEIVAVEPARTAIWRSAADGVTISRVWLFVPAFDGTTHVATAEVLHGPPVRFLRPIVLVAWQALLRRGLDGLRHMLTEQPDSLSCYSPYLITDPTAS